MSGVMKGSCTHLESLFQESGFISAVLHDPPQNCCLQQRDRFLPGWGGGFPPIPPPCTGAWESADRTAQEVLTFHLTFCWDTPNTLERPATHFWVWQISISTLKKKALDQEIWAETCYNILSVSKMYRQPGGEKREDKAQTEIKWVNNFSSLRTHICSS